jgi:hypothetical protein
MPHAPHLSRWHVDDAVTLYHVDRWGLGYFGVSPDGHLEVRPRCEGDEAIDLKSLVDEVRRRGIAPPLLLRFPDLVAARIDELHEAFAAQVLAVLQLLEDPVWARQRLGREEPVGRVDPERLNVWGGSLSVGHPFGATGGRLLITCAHRMEHENARYGLVAACAAGAIGIGMVLERP